jgi:hypothetical protein
VANRMVGACNSDSAIDRNCSACAFEMDSARIRELAAALPPARMQPKQQPSDHPRRIPTRNPLAARYVVEIRDATGASLLLTRADWTEQRARPGHIGSSVAGRHESPSPG